MKGKGKNTKRQKGLHRRNFQDVVNVPRSFVIPSGDLSHNVKTLITDLRTVMLPNTADKLRANVKHQRHRISDVINLAATLKVSHLLKFYITDNSGQLHLKISRLPQGPSIIFRVDDFLCKNDVISSSRANSKCDAKMYATSPCVISNLQPTTQEKHLQLCSKMFLDMFPSIAPMQVQTKDIRRCCLFHYDEEKEVFTFRHYAIRRRLADVSKAVRKCINGNKLPNLGGYKDISDFVFKTEMLSESEHEDEVPLEETAPKERRGKSVNRSIVSLTEIGPRMTLTLIKIEEGVLGGTYLYHRHVQLSPEEALAKEVKRKEREKVRDARRKTQDANVRRKLEEKEAHKKRCLEGKAARFKADENDHINSDDDDDSKYYTEAVGEEPDADLFQRPPKRQKTEKFKKRGNKNEDNDN